MAEDEVGAPRPRRASVVEALRELFPETPAPPLSDVTMIPGSARVKEEYENLLTRASSEVLVFDLPPYSWTVGVANTAVLAAAHRVSIRVLYQRIRVEDENATEWLREVDAYQAAGVVARVAEDVPRKMVVVDRCKALASLVHPGIPSPSYPVTVLVDNAGFAAAEAELFERLWENSLPFPR